MSDPARDIALPDGGEPDLPAPPMEEHEVAALFESLPRRDVIDLRNRLHLELLYGCALRIQESVSLNLKDIDLANRVLLVRNGKGGKDRVLPLVRGVLGALKDYLALRRSLLHGPDHGALLLSRRGDRLNVATFRMWLAEFNRRRGPGQKRVHPHLLRHSIAVHLLRGGADIRHVQEFLGHSSLETTKVYLRLVPGRLKEDYDRAMPEIAVMA
jgi:site-specific recombinase XerD